jgi:hypothetical protein
MSSLSPPVLHRLDLACGPVAEAFAATPYLVGSVQERTSKAGSDVDVRMILTDKVYDRLMKGAPSEGFATFLDLAVSAYLREMTGLPIDFQVQRMTEANANHKGGQRNPLGGRKLTNWIGDARPKTHHRQR